jgi:hypothetical protein
VNGRPASEDASTKIDNPFRFNMFTVQVGLEGKLRNHWQGKEGPVYVASVNPIDRIAGRRHAGMAV